MKNILPIDGEAFYFPNALSAEEASSYLHALRHTLAWDHDEVIIFGKKHITKRKVAWYGDAHFAYTYSGTTRHALPWTTDLHKLRVRAEEVCRTTFNSCLANLYDDGSQGMGYHSDDERTLGRNPAIASLSFGAARKFVFSHRKTKTKVEIILGDGSLLLMQGETQHHWVHALPKSTKVTEPRVNLTFRRFIQP
jgi:alkylated DNA repair dioxygenase AlkB